MLVKTSSPATVPAAWPTWANETESCPTEHAGADAGSLKYPAMEPLADVAVVFAWPLAVAPWVPHAASRREKTSDTASLRLDTEIFVAYRIDTMLPRPKSDTSPMARSHANRRRRGLAKTYIEFGLRPEPAP